jgi:hypothetical protein
MIFLVAFKYVLVSFYRGSVTGTIVVVKTGDGFDELKLSRVIFRCQLSIAQRLRAQTYNACSEVTLYTKRFKNGRLLLD